MTEKKKKFENAEDLQQVKDWFTIASTSLPETTYRKEGLEGYKFYANQQDTDDVLEKLEADNRPASVYNLVKPKVDWLVGLAAQSKKEPRFSPTGLEDEALAELVNGTVKHYSSRLKLTRKELECFEHTVKSGRSLLFFHIDTANPFKPKIKATRIPGYQFYLDASAIEYDYSDSQYFFIERWVPEDQVKAKYPHMDIEVLKGWNEDASGTDNPKFYSEIRNKYRFLECWYFKYEEVLWFINPLSGSPESLTPEEFKAFEKELKTGIEVPEQEAPYILDEEIKTTISYRKQWYYIIFCGEQIAAGGKSPLNWEGFPGVVFGAYKDENKNTWFGVIKVMMDPQIAINTMKRQLSHLLQTLPKGILVHEIGAILNIDQYEEDSAKPNFHLELAKNAIGKYKFEKQPSISPIYASFAQDAERSIDDASGIDKGMMGQYTASREPGVTLRAKQEAGLAVLYTLFENFKESRDTASELLLSLLQQYVTTQETFRIQGAKGMQLVEINSQINPESAGFNDITAGKYDLEADETVESSSMRLSITQMLVDYDHNNPGSIPADIILEYADAPFTIKQQIREAIQIQQLAKEQERQDELNLEMLKLILQYGKDEVKKAQQKLKKKGD